MLMMSTSNHPIIDDCEALGLELPASSHATPHFRTLFSTSRN
jgi:hypothetical protein